MTSTLPARRPDEVRALTRRAFSELGDAVGGIGGMHGAIADRAFGLSGPGASPARVLHDTISQGVYGALRTGAGVVGKGADVVLGQRLVLDGRSVSTTPRGAFAIGVMTGLVGDALERTEPDLAEPMSVRVGGRVVELERDALTEAFPRASRRLVVFVHGLMGTELPWWWFAADGRETYGERLERELGATPVYLRYNTGRHISENGRSMADLLERARRRLAGRGRRARARRPLDGRPGRPLGLPPRRRGRHAVGQPPAPHGHARHPAHGRADGPGRAQARPRARPPARDAHVRAASSSGAARGSATCATARSSTRTGATATPTSCARAATAEVPLLPDATHCFVAATITRSPDHPLGRLLGDMLVLSPSASGRSRTRKIPFRAEYGFPLGAANHLALLNHPAVADQLVRWLSAPPQLVGAVTP